MLFAPIFISALVFLQGSFAAPAARAPDVLSVQQVVNNIGTVTKMSGDLAKAIEPLGIRSSPADVAAASRVSSSFHFDSPNDARLMHYVHRPLSSSTPTSLSLCPNFFLPSTTSHLSTVQMAQQWWRCSKMYVIFHQHFVSASKD